MAQVGRLTVFVNCIIVNTTEVKIEAIQGSQSYRQLLRKDFLFFIFFCMICILHVYTRVNIFGRHDWRQELANLLQLPGAEMFWEYEGLA